MTRRCVRRHVGGEAASVGLGLVLVAAVLATAVVLVATSAAAVLVARQRAAVGADAAALAAAHRAHPLATTPGSPRAAAEEAARRVGGSVLACRCTPGLEVVVVTVAVPVTAPLAVALGVDAATGTARATLVP